MSLKNVLKAAVVMAVAVFIAGCGDDDDDSNTVAEEAAGTINVAPRDIGVVNLVRQSPAEDKIDRFYEAAGEALGWNVEIVDGGGDPAKIARAVQNFLNQNVDAIITTSNEAATIRGQLQEAKQKGIPVINTNGAARPSDLYTAQYEEDETQLGAQLAANIAETIEDPKIGNLATSIAYSGVLRNDALEAELGDAVVDEQEVDLTNPVADTEAKLNAMLTADPDINTVWAVYDNMAQAAVSTIESKRSDAKLYTFYTTEQNVQNLRSETPLQALSDVNAPKTGAVAFDQLLGFFEKDEPIDPQALQEFPLEYEVVTRDNIDELLGDRDELFTNEEILQPFIEKWQEEYPG